MTFPPPPLPPPPRKPLLFSRHDYEMRPIGFDVARPMVEAEHYSGGASNTACYLHGLFRRDGERCLGVAWWLPPTKVAAQSVAGDNWRRCVSLSRLVILPEVPTNGASFLMAASIREIRKIGAWDVLVTWADQGQGHTGAIYRATNWEYMGVTKSYWRYRHPNGSLMSKKRGPKTFSHQEMLSMGYKAEGPFAKHKFRMVLRVPRPSHPRTSSRPLYPGAPPPHEEPGSHHRTDPG